MPRGMSEPLLRLSAQLDSHIPQFAVVAVARWAVSQLWRAAAFAACIASPRLATRCRLGVRTAGGWLNAIARIGWTALTLFVAQDAYEHARDFTTCKLHDGARPMGVAAGVALLCFVCTTRLSVSLSCFAAFVCVKERNCLSGAASVCTVCIWGNFREAAVYSAGLCIAAAVHGTVCVQPSSATLAVWCFCWVWVSVVGSFVRSAGRFLLKS